MLHYGLKWLRCGGGRGAELLGEAMRVAKSLWAMSGGGKVALRYPRRTERAEHIYSLWQWVKRRPSVVGVSVGITGMSGVRGEDWPVSIVILREALVG